MIPFGNFILSVCIVRMIGIGGDSMLNKLRLLRNEKGISQQTLADAVGVSQPSIFKYETTNVEPDIETLKRMADYFETSVDFIVGHTDIRRKIESTDSYELNQSEKELIESFRALSTDERACILMTVKTFLKK